MGVLFYLRSDGQYILVSAAITAVFFLIIILCDVLIVLFFLRTDGQYSFDCDAIMAVFVYYYIL